MGCQQTSIGAEREAAAINSRTALLASIITASQAESASSLAEPVCNTVWQRSLSLEVEQE
jgi:hypothetical protein